MITQEQFISAIETMRLQRYEDKKNGEWFWGVKELYNQIIELLSIWFDKEELLEYCFILDFGKMGLESEYEAPSQLYLRLKK